MNHPSDANGKPSAEYPQRDEGLVYPLPQDEPQARYGRPPPRAPTLDELVNNAVADLAIEGMHMTPDEIEKVRDQLRREIESGTLRIRKHRTTPKT